MHDYVMSIKNRLRVFVQSTAGHDAVLAGLVLVVLSCSSAVVLVAPSVLTNDLPASSLCGSSKTVFTTFASDRPC